MNLQRLEQLKEKMGSAKNIQDVFEYFLQYFGENETFLNLGSRVRDELLEGFMLAIGKQLFGANCTVERPLLIAVPGTTFIHGGCGLGGRIANVLYFSDVQAGVLTVLPGRPGEMTQFSRFSAQRVPNEAAPHEN